jgi:translocator protein
MSHTPAAPRAPVLPDVRRAGARDWLALALFVAVSFAAGAVGALFTGVTESPWFRNLERPAWYPPEWVFGPVWSLLYLLMGVAAWLVWRPRGWEGARAPLTLFGAQLVLNAAWTWIFFGLRMPGPAFVEIVALWLVLLATIVAFWRVSRLAGGLMVPYLAWVTFAAALNFAIWRLNA